MSRRKLSTIALLSSQFVKPVIIQLEAVAGLQLSVTAFIKQCHYIYMYYIEFSFHNVRAQIFRMSGHKYSDLFLSSVFRVSKTSIKIVY
jgi:hypothetical protein